MATNIETVTRHRPQAEQPQQASADRIPLPRIIGYGIGDFGFNFYWFSLTLFLAYYYTDVLGLRSEVAGLIIFLCLTWDGLIDPAIGVLANRTRTRWGKYRPYLLFGSVPLAASFALMFAPTGLEGAALIGYAFATQVLFRTMYGLVNIPYSALMATMTRDSMQRNWLAGVRMICAFLGTAVVSYFTPRLVTYFTSGGRTTGYFGATAVLAVIATVFTLLTFAATREDSSITHAQEQPPPVSELLRMLAKNVPFLQIIAGIGFFSFANILVCSGLVYYVKYYLGETEAIAGEAASLMQITITAMILPWTLAARYVGKRWAWQAGLAIAFAGLVGLYLSERARSQRAVRLHRRVRDRQRVDRHQLLVDRPGHRRIRRMAHRRARRGVRVRLRHADPEDRARRLLRVPRRLPRLGRLCSQSAAGAGDGAGDQGDDYIGGGRRPARLRARHAFLPAGRAARTRGWCRKSPRASAGRESV